jgi:hypothetical protein
MFFLMQKHFIAGSDARSREMTPKIAFIGAGSTIFMKNIVGDALRHPRWPTPCRADGYRRHAARGKRAVARA